MRGENIPQGGTTQFFSDVPKEASYFSAVMSAQACGYISGEQGSSFRPDDAITISEAITILGRMLNYTMHAEQNGGYPLGYFDAAMKGGLYRGGNSETALLSFDRMIDLLEDSIDAAFLDEIAFTSNGGSHYTFNENKTILTEYWNARKIKGTVTANEYSDLSGSNGNDGFITIYDGSTSKRLAVKYEPYNEYLGYEVSGYYNDENELLYLGIIKNRNIIFRYFGHY